jgi:uncharacterized protein YndB with AHSA1/START domain
MATTSMAPTSHVSPDNDVVTSEIFIAAPRERVFEALTDPKQALLWWGQNDRYHLNEFHMDVRPGGKWSTTGASAKMGDIKVGGEFLEIDPPRRLAYTWSSSWMPKSTKVLWELEVKDGGTFLRLTHTGFAGDAEQATNHTHGWNQVIVWLQAYVERGETVASRT